MAGPVMAGTKNTLASATAELQNIIRHKVCGAMIAEIAIWISVKIVPKLFYTFKRSRKASDL